MEYHDVVRLVEKSIKECETTILNCPGCVLSEADFERKLTNIVDGHLHEHKDVGWEVHNQISCYYYNKEEESKMDKAENCKRKPDYRVDIVLFKSDYLYESDKHHKGFIYTNASIAIELKYFRTRDSIKEIDNDFEKSELLTNGGADKDSTLFIVPLFEKYCTKKIENINNRKAKLDSHKVRVHILCKENINKINNN